MDNCQPDCADGTVTWVTVNISLGGVVGATATDGGHYTTAYMSSDGSTPPCSGSVSGLFEDAEGGTQGNY